MGIRGYTKNYKLIKPEYDTDTWHDYEYDNLDTIDAVLSAIYASGDWQGFWKNNTNYKAGSVVIDKDTDTMYKVVADHTTDGNVTFAEYMFNHPEYYQLWSPNNLAKDWAIKDDGLADNQDYSAKAYAVGGVGTETNNAKYYSEQAGLSANMSAEQAAASASSATASYNSEQLALSYANQSASSASASQTGAEQSAASAAISQEQAEYAANKAAGLETFVQEKQNEISASLAEAIKASEDAKKYAIEASGANIGDIFYTSRLDNELNGAVEANGAVYSVEAFTGEQSVPELLRKGSLPYVSMAEYESIVSANGSCRAWGWDNGDTFRVPTAEKMKRVLVAKKEATTKDLTWYNLYSDGWLEQGGYFLADTVTVTFLKAFATTAYSVQTTCGTGTNDRSVRTFPIRLGSKATTSMIIQSCPSFDQTPVYWYACGYAEVPTEVEYQFQNIETHRAMVQLSTGVKEDATQLKEYKFNNPHFFGESKWTDVEPKNSSWLVSNGAYHSGRTYGDYYKWLTDIKSGNKTVNGVSVKSVDDEYTDYDFVINTADSTFRLPLLNGEEDLVGERFDDLALIPSGGTYTAPANGELTCILNMSGAYSNMGVARNGQMLNTFFASGTIALGDTFKANKGDVFTIFYQQASGTPTKSKFIFTYAKGNGTLYFYVGDTLQDPALINAGRALNDIAELKGHAIVEEYHNGTDGYRIWSNGFIEQWGKTVRPISETEITVNFLIPFKDTDYIYVDSIQSDGFYAGVFNMRWVQNTGRTTTSIKVWSNVDTSRNWFACGYIR